VNAFNIFIIIKLLVCVYNRSEHLKYGTIDTVFIVLYSSCVYSKQTEWTTS